MEQQSILNYSDLINRHLASDEICFPNRPSPMGDLEVIENQQFAIRPTLSGEISTDLFWAHRQTVSGNLEIDENFLISEIRQS
jgi:hypothetical protein